MSADTVTIYAGARETVMLLLVLALMATAFIMACED
jgi:hypothetical protein